MFPKFGGGTQPNYDGPTILIILIFTPHFAIKRTPLNHRCGKLNMRVLELIACAFVGAAASSSILQPLPKHFKQGNSKVVFVKRPVNEVSQIVQTHQKWYSLPRIVVDTWTNRSTI